MRVRAAALAVAAILAVVVPAGGQENPDCRTHGASTPAMTAECEDTGRQLDVGVATFEPTIGVDAQGALYYSTTPGRGPALGRTAGIARSADEGATWSDITPLVNGPETYDPYIYVDASTGRVFQFHMFPLLTCSVLSFSDDGGSSWTTNPAGCGPTGVWDHQTIVAAAPRTLTPVGYPNVVHQCVNAVYAAMCSRSLDGGLTWSPSTPAFRNENGLLCALHGHLSAAPDGTLYLPTTLCGQQPTVYVSRDDGLTWRKSVVSTLRATTMDPAVTVDADGNAYFVWSDPTGLLLMAHSTDAGTTWSAPVVAAPEHLTTALPAVVAGDPGNVVIAYPGTADLPQRAATPPSSVPASQVRWGGYLSWTTDALAEDPTFTTVRATGEDPLMRGHVCDLDFGRCAVQVDFIGVALSPDGRPFASLVDGCVGPCAATGGGNNADRGVVITVDTAVLCAESCWMFDPADAVAPQQDALGALPRLEAPVPHDEAALALQRRRLALRDALAAGVEPRLLRVD